MKIEHSGKTKFYTIIPIFLYFSVTRLLDEYEKSNKAAKIYGMHITPWIGIGICILTTKKREEYDRNF